MADQNDRDRSLPFSHIDSVQVWVTSIDEMEIGEEMNLFLSDLNPAEKNKALKFYFVEDQKRSIISTLLQRAKIRGAFCITERDYEIKRTREVCNG